jgi:hypothetical protein
MPENALALPGPKSLEKRRSATEPSASCYWLALQPKDERSPEVEAVKVHHLVPSRHKVTHESLLRVA